MRSIVEIGASVPAFLGKLWKLVNDSETNHLISWSPGGKTFVIKNQADFARELLPLYYKHNNMASFIRQLNMYGFHKITSVENGGLRYEKDEIEFSHPCFMKGHAYLLEHIKRKIANPKTIVTSNENGEKILIKPEVMNKVLADVKQMKGKQESLDAKFSAMKQENEALWREVAILRQKHIKQQQIVNNLIQFLMSLVQPTRAGGSGANGVGVKRPYQLMINSAAHNATGSYPTAAKNAKFDKEAGLLEELIEDNIEEGPTIFELAHDDALHNEASQDSMGQDYVTVDVSTTSPDVAMGHSPNGTSLSAQYHVTMEDGDDQETDGEQAAYTINHNGLLTTAELPTTPSPGVPTVTTPTLQLIDPTVLLSPGTSKSKHRSQVNRSPSSFNTMNPSADLKLPAEIFASDGDDSVSDAGLSAEDQMHNALQDHITNSSLLTKDKMFGGINIKVERPDSVKGTTSKAKKSSKNCLANLKIENIKTELQDDQDWGSMSVATVNNNTDVNKYHTVSDIDDHLDTMQTDLESLRELLRSDSYAFDTNTLMGLFGADDPFYGLSFNPVDERTKPTNSAKKLRGEVSNVSSAAGAPDLAAADDDGTEGTNQLITYTGEIPDFVDIEAGLDSEQVACASPAAVEGAPSVLNTPQPTPRARR
ncbi:heat shock factor protein isoform X3 [Plutella xylostella]|uniref:heat shock factor protein isoform X3 n=1 Tax=Plutella xylostella TaxID=51655 RepID=UPI0020328FEE|nr:heat shock factor protein isoform X3 [Plutella xylostella]